MMKQNKLFNKVSSLLLASAMTVSMFPSLTTHVHAQENTLPDVTQFATKEQLMTEFDTDMTDGVDNSAKIYFGWDQDKWDYNKWWIVGKDSDEKFGSENIVVFQTYAPLGSAGRFYYISQNSDFPRDYTLRNKDEWKESKYPEGIEISEVFVNHYGASDIDGDPNIDAMFTQKQKELMNVTTIYSYDMYNNQIYSTDDYLYAPFGNNGEADVMVGSNQPDSLSGNLRINNKYWNAEFWLRNPDTVSERRGRDVFYANVYDWTVKSQSVKYESTKLYAFNLDLSTVSFASSARGA